MFDELIHILITAEHVTELGIAMALYIEWGLEQILVNGREVRWRKRLHMVSKTLVDLKVYGHKRNRIWRAMQGCNR